MLRGVFSISSTSSGSGAGPIIGRPAPAESMTSSIMSDDESFFMGPDAAHADATSMVIIRYERMNSTRASELLAMTVENPPAYDGVISWFQYQERVDEWCDITTSAPDRRGPLLKSRLCGLAETYKQLLDPAQLKDEDNGVNYFKNTLRKHFLKGSDHTFL